MNIYLQTSASRQPRTRLPKLGLPACITPRPSNQQLSVQVKTMIWSQPAVGTASSEAKQPAGTSENLRSCDTER